MCANAFWSIQTLSDLAHLGPCTRPCLNLARHWTIWGISLQALAFFLASAIQGGSSWGRAAGGRPRWEDAVCPESPAGLEAGFSGAGLDEKGGEATGGVLGEVAVLERDGGLVQEGGFCGTGTGVGGDRDL